MKMEVLTDPQVVEVDVSVVDMIDEIGRMPKDEGRVAILNALTTAGKVIQSVANGPQIEMVTIENRRAYAAVFRGFANVFDPPTDQESA